MTYFHFMHAHFSDPDMSSNKIIERLADHQRGRLVARSAYPKPLQSADAAVVQKWLDRRDDIRQPRKDQQKIENRADLISQKHKAGTGLSHIRADDVKKLDALRPGVRLARIETEHHADKLAPALHAEFPWMWPATETVWHAMRPSVMAGDPGLRYRP